MPTAKPQRSPLADLKNVAVAGPRLSNLWQQGRGWFSVFKQTVDGFPLAGLCSVEGLCLCHVFMASFATRWLCRSYVSVLCD